MRKWISQADEKLGKSISIWYNPTSYRFSQFFPHQNIPRALSHLSSSHPLVYSISLPLTRIRSVTESTEDHRYKQHPIWLSGLSIHPVLPSHFFYFSQQPLSHLPHIKNKRSQPLNFTHYQDFFLWYGTEPLSNK